MEEIIRNLELLVFENKLLRAHEESKKVLKTDLKLSQELFDLIQKVFELNEETNISTLYIFLEKALEANLNFTTYLKTILTSSDEKDFFYFYPIAKEYFIKNGMLIDFEMIFSRYKKNLLKSKSYTKLLSEIELLEETGVDLGVTPSEKALCHLGEGDIKYFEIRYEHALENKSKTILNGLALDFDDPVWRKQSFVMKELALRSSGDFSFEAKKDFLKSIYELLLVNNEEKFCLELLLDYAKDMGHKELAHLVIEDLVNHHDADKSFLLRKIEGMKFIKRDGAEEIDLADDLFDEGIEKQDITIRRLVNQINILKDERDLEGATELLKRLKEIDKEHTLVKELEEKEHKLKGSKLSSIKKSISEIEQDLLNELSVYTKSVNDVTSEDESYLKLYTKKNIELMPIDELKEQKAELIYSYNALGFYENSLKVISRILSECEVDLKDELDILYLKSEIMRMNQNYYGALNEVEKCIDEKPMTENEKISFYYLKGEILRELGRKKDALKSYAKVYSLNKKFRMVAYRLKEIE